MGQEGPVAKSARNWRSTSDLTPSIRPIGAAYAISTSRSRGTGGPLSCKTATQISNPDTIAIRTGRRSWGERHKGAGFEKSNRTESMFTWRNTAVPTSTRIQRYFFPFLLFFFSRFVLTSLRAQQQSRFLSGPLNFRFFVELNQRVKSAKNN